MTECPACLPPDNATCATCSGSWSVSEEVLTEFLAQKELQESFNDFKNLVLEALANSENIEQARQYIVELAQSTLRPESVEEPNV